MHGARRAARRVQRAAQRGMLMLLDEIILR